VNAIYAHPYAALTGLAGLVLIVVGLAAWYLGDNGDKLADLRDQAARIMSPVMAGPAVAPDPYDDPDLRGFYGPHEKRRRAVRLADEQRWTRVSPTSVMMLREDTPRPVRLVPAAEPVLVKVPGGTEETHLHHVVAHSGADASWGATLHAIVESDDRGSLLPAGMADPDIEAAYAALTAADIEQARDEASWTSAYQRADRAIAAAVDLCGRNLAALLGPQLVAEVDSRNRRRADLAAAYISGEHLFVDTAPTARAPRLTPAQRRRQTHRDNRMRGAVEAAARELVSV
jgi:hypothetical protein